MPPSQPTNTCENCRFFESTSAALRSGECRKNPPAVVYTTFRAETLFPLVLERHWCGAFEKR